MNIKKILATTIVICFIVSPMAVLALENNVPINESCPEGKFCPNVNLPTLQSPVDISTALGEYIKAWYAFIIGSVGILAAVMIMYAGFMWITSAGNNSKIGEAKEIIMSAIAGLVIAFLSYTILALINPNLTVITTPNLQSRQLSLENTDNDLDNDKDILEQVAQLSYDWTPYISPLLELAYIGMERVTGFLIAQGDVEAIEAQLASHNVNIDENTGLENANQTNLASLNRMGNTFGEMNIDYENGRMFLQEGEEDIVNQIISRDPDGFNRQTSTQTQSGWFSSEQYTQTILTGVDFDYVDNQGNITRHDITLIGNAANDGRWEIIFTRVNKN